MHPTTITQTMDQQLIWDDLQSICVQQQYTNTVRRRTWVPNNKAQKQIGCGARLTMMMIYHLPTIYNTTLLSTSSSNISIENNVHPNGC